MSKKFHIIAGLPRSGSTLLCNLLNQNLKCHATETSALSRILTSVKAGWENIPENVASNNINKKEAVLKAIVQGYFEDINKEVIFDRNRAWASEPELAKLVFGKDTKIILCVRNLVDILASFEKLFRKNNSVFDITDKKLYPDNFNTVEKRCDIWASTKGPVGSSLEILKELFIRSYDNLLIVEFDELIMNTQETLNKIYKFIEEDNFVHDLENIEQTIFEDDRFHGMLGLHNIQNKIVIPTNDSRLVLGNAVYKKYNGGEFWRN